MRLQLPPLFLLSMKYYWRPTRVPAHLIFPVSSVGMPRSGLGILPSLANLLLHQANVSSLAIRKGERWRMRYNHNSFEQYCEERWELQIAHVHRLINAASLAVKFSQRENLSAPSSERHIRRLLERLEAGDDRIAVCRDVLATTNGSRIKARRAMSTAPYVTLDEWRDIDAMGRPAMVGRIGKGTLGGSAYWRRPPCDRHDGRDRP
jgi:hypothetical protein